jgi:hypothetical protein
MLRRITLPSVDGQCFRRAYTSTTTRSGRLVLKSSTGQSQPGQLGLVHYTQRRQFLGGMLGRSNNSVDKVAVDEVNFDKQYSHWSGKLFGVPMDRVVYYMKINGGVLFICATIYMFFQGYVWLSHFSLATVGRLGFMGGFFTCGILYSMALTVRRMYNISPNAVYNQAISIAMKNPKVLDHLGPSPRTGDFKAYCASGGFKFPLLRRLRSGQYELADLLGTKPKKLQMVFILRNPNGNEGLISCEVRKAQNRMLSSNYYFQSLSAHLTGPGKEPHGVAIIGREGDSITKGIFKF